MPLITLLMEDIAEYTNMTAACRSKIADRRMLYSRRIREQTVRVRNAWHHMLLEE